MEPMTLGSPTGTPVAGTSPYLPSFLMGDVNSPSTPRSNTLSPTKGKSISFGNTSLNMGSPTDFNKSHFDSRPLFGHQETPKNRNFTGTPANSSTSTISGPPTQSLFDLLKQEKNQVQTPKKPYNFNQSLVMDPQSNSMYFNQSTNDSYLNQSNFNTSRITSPVHNPIDFRSNHNTLNLQGYSSPAKLSDFWVTIFGFPQSATSLILSHFSQCGTIIDKVFPPHNGNWVHLKFSSRLECDKALNYNEKILGNNIMIGVTHCKDKNIVDKENFCDNNQSLRIRPLSQVAYQTAQCDSAVVDSPSLPRKSSGIVNKAMDLLFGW